MILRSTIENEVNKLLNDIFLSKIKKVARKIRNLKATSKERQLLIDDLLQCNNEDLLDVLILADFKTCDDYIKAVNSFLSLECLSFDYPILLIYKIGNMKDITDFIILYHRQLAVTKKIKDLCRSSK